MNTASNAITGFISTTWSPDARCRDALGPLLENEHGHRAAGVELELDDGSSGIREASLRPRDEGGLLRVGGLHEQRRAVATEGQRGAGCRFVLTDIAIE